MKNLRYVIYARKSSEGEDRQVQSIDDQIKRLREIQRLYNLNVVKEFRESKSAKLPYKRPEFKAMLDHINNGKADAILCWHINRLSRNPLDSGEISWLLQTNAVKEIRTSERTYLPNDNILILSVEQGMANQFSRDLSSVVKRGMNSKLDKGIFPGKPPIGYLNDYENHTIIIDPDRFDLIKRAFDLFLAGSVTANRLTDILADEWGVRSKVRKRSGGKPMAKSGVYTMLRNPFYAGMINWSGKLYKGNHKPMISYEQHLDIVDKLSRSFTTRPSKNKIIFALRGLLRCGECGCAITAERKTKKLKNGGYNTYVYYHCTYKKTDINCLQRSAIKEEDLEQQVIDEISKYTIHPEFAQWALDTLKENNDIEANLQSKTRQNLQYELEKLQSNRTELVRMRLDRMIDDTEYEDLKNQIEKDLLIARDKLDQNEKASDNWIVKAENIFDFAVNAKRRFENGDFDTKREIMLGLGADLLVKDKRIQFKPIKYLVPIKKFYPALEKEYLRLELDTTPESQRSKIQKDAVASLNSSWQKVVREVRKELQCC